MPPLEPGRWQGAQLLRLERQWQDAGFPKLGTEASDWFHTQITAAETAYLNAIYDNMPDPDGGIAAGLSRTRQQKTRSRVRTRFKRSRVIGLPFRTRGSMKATKRLVPVHRMPTPIHNGSLLDILPRSTWGVCAIKPQAETTTSCCLLSGALMCSVCPSSRFTLCPRSQLSSSCFFS